MFLGILGSYHYVQVFISPNKFILNHYLTLRTQYDHLRLLLWYFWLPTVGIC